MRKTLRPTSCVFLPPSGRCWPRWLGPKLDRAAEAGKYLGPSSLVASRNGARLFVANLDARQVAVLDVAQGRVEARLAMPAEPSGMVLSPDGSKLYVTCAAPQSTVCVIDAASLKIVGSLPAGHTAMGPAISPDGKRLYVCNRFDADVSVIDLAAGKEIARVPAVREPYGAVVTPDGKSVFVINHLPLDRADGYDVAARVTVIDTATNAASTHPFAQRQHKLAGDMPFARRQVRLRDARAGPLPDADHAIGTRLDEHQRAVDHRHGAKKLLNTVLLGRRRSRRGQPLGRGLHAPMAGRFASRMPAPMS